MSLAPSVSVIIPVRNGEATLGNCLAAVLAMEYPPGSREIVVVDNRSTDRTAEIARRYPVRYLFEEERGAANARNRAIRETEGDVLAFVDADCMVTRRWLGELMPSFGDDDTAAAAGELVAYPPATHAERYTARRKPRWQQWASAGPFPWFLIGNCAIRRRVFDRIGLLDPEFGIVGCEDIEFSRRFFDAGLRIAYCPRALAFHRHRATARTLFAQQHRNGRGQSLIQYHYRSCMRWSWRQELGAWQDLAAGAWRLLTALPGSRSASGRDRAFWAYYDLVRKLAQRIGFVEGALRWRLGAARRSKARPGPAAPPIESPRRAGGA